MTEVAEAPKSCILESYNLRRDCIVVQKTYTVPYFAWTNISKIPQVAVIAT